MELFTTVDRRVLDRYNEVMDANFEEPYCIREDGNGGVEDCARDVLMDTAYDDKLKADPPRFTIGADFLIEEVRYNLIEKQGDMADGQVECGDWTPQKCAGLKRRNQRIFDEFKAFCDQYPPVAPWKIADIERGGVQVKAA